MTRTSTSLALRSTVKDHAQGRCEYCHLPEEVGFARYEVDHVISEQHGGKTEQENLAYACMVCNKRKGPNLSSIDPETGERAWLYNPRTQQWDDHFQLNREGTIIGLTAEGRATAFLLVFNDFERVEDRRELIELKKFSL